MKSRIIEVDSIRPREQYPWRQKDEAAKVGDNRTGDGHPGDVDDAVDSVGQSRVGGVSFKAEDVLLGYPEHEMSEQSQGSEDGHGGEQALPPTLPTCEGSRRRNPRGRFV